MERAVLHRSRTGRKFIQKRHRMKAKVENKQAHMFSNLDLRKLLIPLMIEQLLNCLMGMVDTVMVSNVGSAAISAVSLVDSLNILVIQAFTALSAGGTIVCAHYIGKKEREQATEAARQTVLVVTVMAVVLMVICLAFQRPLLQFIFGSVEPDVMQASLTYFFYTAISFPFIGLYDAGASIFRAQENSRCPMTISVISNFLNIGGNAFFIWGLHMGVKGAAIATLASRIFCGIAVMYFLYKPSNRIPVREYRTIRPRKSLIGKILRIGIPSGIENGMFQFGKLAIQSTVSTLGTISIAAQAMTNMLEMLNGMAIMGIGIGLMTIVGQCMGAGRKDEAAYYIKKLTAVGEVGVIICCLAVFALTKPVTILGGMESESAAMCLQMMFAITLVKPIVWTLSFIPAYGLRAAGDVRFSMIVSAASMWIFRVSLCVFLCRCMGFGPMAVWIGMFTDWTVRAVIFTARFYSGKWMNFHVIH